MPSLLLRCRRSTTQKNNSSAVSLGIPIKVHSPKCARAAQPVAIAKPIGLLRRCRVGSVFLALAMPHRPSAVSRTEACDSTAEASVATGNLRQVDKRSPIGFTDTKTEDCPSLDEGRCGKPVVCGIDRFCGCYLRYGSGAARRTIVPLADRVRYSRFSLAHLRHTLGATAVRC